MSLRSSINSNISVVGNSNSDNSVNKNITSGNKSSHSLLDSNDLLDEDDQNEIVQELKMEARAQSNKVFSVIRYFDKFKNKTYIHYIIGTLLVWHDIL